MHPLWHRLALLLVLAFIFTGCAGETDLVLPTTLARVDITPLPSPSATIAPTPAFPTSVPPALATATATPTRLLLPPVTPGPAGQCGVLLPVVIPAETPPTFVLNANASLDAFPVEVRPAVRQILEDPTNVSLVAYRIGEEADGLYLNADTPRPVASVVKVIHLVAYAAAVSNGELDPEQPVPLADLAAYYLPNSDLNAHPQALSELEAEERIFGDPPAVQLADVPRMMIQYSSNAATDYLHQLLGQERIEQTILDLGMMRHTAPCPFLGQSLIMTNPETAQHNLAAVRSYIAQPERYSVEVMNLTARYATDAGFRAEIDGWRGRDGRPSIETQRLFHASLNTQGSAGEYAGLMARIAQNQLGPWSESVLIRRYLEWPTFFPANQGQMAWLGYKGGSFPGVLSVSYYAQPWWRTDPVVVTLFYQDLPQNEYNRWRREQPHDELARWLLREPDAIPILKALIEAQTP